MKMIKHIYNYFQLTKPSIMLLVLAAGATSIFIEGSLISHPLKLAAFFIGLYLTGGCANSLNQYLESEIDAKMIRTSSRRPIPAGSVTRRQALVFSIIIGILGVTIFAAAFNFLTAALSVGTILFYGFFYTLLLKPRTSQNIVIGGIAGAMAPVGAWTAATGTMAVTPWLIFLIIFIWTPPHFWSLALKFKEDYRRAELPMLPNIKGDVKTLNWILFYTLTLLAVSLLPLMLDFGWIYSMTAVTLGGIFIYKAMSARKNQCIEKYWELFRFSIIYLFTIFLALVIDNWAAVS